MEREFLMLEINSLAVDIQNSPILRNINIEVNPGSWSVWWVEMAPERPQPLKV